jgi:nitrogen fixation protein FixH
MTKGSWWPLIIAGALALHVVASLIVVYVATSDPSYAVEENYYQKAVAWDDKRAQDRVNQDLGWSLSFEAEPPARPGEQPLLEVGLVDALGTPINSATVTVETFHNARSHDIVHGTLKEAGHGLYSARLPMRRNGRWELRFTVDRGGDHFTHTETRHLFVEGSWK